ncbi:diguanylate cyclase domain-containing protein [Pseudoalteromonas mariniglutinosa]|uniref:diguanylate cyclase domain-containing protein n=1 Tax=Pseudoalteromonas mariniglutinosa TaxID=206042 RepID=UPI00384F8DD3
MNTLKNNSLMKKKVSLLILNDDNKFTLQLVDTLALDTSYEYKISITNNILHAMTLINETIFDIIILDDNIAYKQQQNALKKSLTMAKQPLLVILAESKNTHIENDAATLGAHDYFLKDKVDIHWLHRAINYLLETKSSQRQLQQSNEQLNFVKKQLNEEKSNSRKKLDQALHDSLTGLPSRSLLTEKLTQAIGMSQRHDSLVALLFLDLDKFKAINDKFGHYIGDLLLQQVAQRLQNAVRDTDTVFRQGGDEFVVLLATISLPQDAYFTATKLAKLLCQPYAIEGHVLQITVSIGVSVYPDHGDNMQTLLKYADKAMYAEKSAHHNTVHC